MYIRIVGHNYYVDSEISEDSQWNAQNSIKDSYDINNNNQLTNKHQQHGYQFVNPELDVQWFERILQNSKQSTLKRKRRLSVYSTIGTYVSKHVRI